MNKSDIKQIIVEEIESTLEEIAGGINIGGTFEEDMDSMSPEELIASTFFDEEGMDLEENEEEFLRNLKRTDPDKLLKIKAWANYNLNVRRKNPNLKFADYIKTYRPYNIPNPPGRQLSLFDEV